MAGLPRTRLFDHRFWQRALFAIAVPIILGAAPEGSHTAGRACPGTDQPTIDCAAISAQADLEEAHQAKRAADLFGAELVISILALCAAGAAARFAWSASQAAHDANRPWLQMNVGPGPFRIGAANIEMDLNLRVTNRGRSPATNVVPFSRLLIFDADEEIPIHVARDTTISATKRWIGGVIEFGNAVFPGAPEDFEVTAYGENEPLARAREADAPSQLVVVIGVRYRFLKRDRFSVEAFSLGILNEHLEGLRAENVVLQDNEYVFVQHPSTYMT